jgi:hypothetical protein
MNTSDLIKRVDQLIEQGKAVLASKREKVPSYPFVDSGKFPGFRSGALSFVERVYGTQHSHYNEFRVSVHSDSSYCVEAGIGILESIKEEISGNWLFSIKGLITAEIFADFLEMAEYLLAQDYKDPAAVVAGSVLEEHLRQLCTRNDIDVETESEGKLTPKKADRMNADLAKAEVYNKLDQKLVTAWLDLRNKAAHGKYEEYNKEQVQQMLQGITEFLARVSI